MLSDGIRFAKKRMGNELKRMTEDRGPTTEDGLTIPGLRSSVILCFHLST